MKRIAAILLFALAAISCKAGGKLVLGDERTDVYIPQLQGNRVALLSNHTGLVGGQKDKHILDFLIANDITVSCIFSPEHGFRGNADAGEKVSSSTDPKTGVPIVSLYSSRGHMPSSEDMARFDVLVVDIQDVGLRFYTYYITMMHLMEACALDGKRVIVLDRPNPNGNIVDGPVLDMELSSGVGAIPVPVLHGMTLGELALMINGEGWLPGSVRCDLAVVPCLGYTHSTRYELPVAPSPNLRTMRAIYLYPSMCFFEGTVVSLGRGTDSPFEIYGHPRMAGEFSFTPQSTAGAKNPPLLGQLCHGVDLRSLPMDELWAKGVDLSYVIDAYQKTGEPFFLKNGFFDKLAGVRYVREMILNGADAGQIRERWELEDEAFMVLRQKYLLYE